MKPPTILIVDDNPLTRKVVRATLMSSGYAVLEAENGRAALDAVARHSPDLILQDIVLPDLDGFELVKLLRALPGAGETPILAFSAFPAKLEQARRLRLGFQDHILKPIEPSRLLGIIRNYARPDEETLIQPGRGRVVMVVDDDPLQRKLLRVRLEQLGFVAKTAEDGADGLEQMHRSPPDAIISDVLMPRLDGFKLCLEVQKDPQLAHIPIVLTSAAFNEEADRRLAESVGATALVLRTPDLREVIETLLSSLDESTQPEATRPIELPTADYVDRIAVQLSNQAAISANLSQRLEWMEAKLSLLGGLAETTKRNIAADTAVNDILHRALECTGALRGAAYLIADDRKVELRAQLYFTDVAPGELTDFFGCIDVLWSVMDGQEPLDLPTAQGSVPGENELLRRSGAVAMSIIPLIYDRMPIGALVVEWAKGERPQEQRLVTATVTSQVSKAIALIRALADLRESQELLARTIETIPSGVIVADVDGQVTLANNAAERIFGVPRAEMASWKHGDAAWGIIGRYGEPFPKEELPFARVMRTDNAVYGVELTIEQHAGKRMLISVNAAPIRNEHGDIIGVVQSMSEITEQRRTEEALERALDMLEIRVQERTADLVKANEALQAEIAERKRAEEALKEAHDMLERRVKERTAELARSNADLEQFAYVASHDLQEPLRMVASYVQLLERRYKGRLDPDADEFIAFAVGGATRMHSLINDLLHYSRVGTAGTTLAPVDSSSTLDQALGNLQFSIEENGALVTSDPLPIVVGDPSQLVQLFQNLVGNAIRFHSNEPPRVHVSAEQKGDEWVFSVCDNGIGISPEFVDRIFLVFQRLHTYSEYPGNGIGLAICKKIVERHGGRIWVEPGHGQGSTFCFTLPAIR